MTVIVQRILSFDTVTSQSIFGAISAYLIIGLMFAAFYAADRYSCTGGHFFAGTSRATPRRSSTSASRR